MLYVLNLYSSVCQLYLNKYKEGRKEKIIEKKEEWNKRRKERKDGKNKGKKDRKLGRNKGKKVFEHTIKINKRIMRPL